MASLQLAKAVEQYMHTASMMSPAFIAHKTAAMLFIGVHTSSLEKLKWKEGHASSLVLQVPLI